jgi:hypothetical protein
MHLPSGTTRGSSFGTTTIENKGPKMSKLLVESRDVIVKRLRFEMKAPRYVAKLARANKSCSSSAVQHQESCRHYLVIVAANVNDSVCR